MNASNSVPKPIENPVAGNPAFLKLFTAGLIGWLVGLLILFAVSWPVSKPDGFASAVIWTISYWWLAFALGFLSLVVFGLVARLPIAKASIAYLLPAAILAAVAGICLSIYPDSALRLDLFTYLPVVWAFYVFGGIWVAMRGRVANAGMFVRAIVPALFGGLIIIGLVAVPAFGSDAFRYRNAFRLNITKTTLRDGTITSEGELEIRKQGSYEFIAPRYLWDEMMVSSEDLPRIEHGEITWGKGAAPAHNALGVFPFKIVWRRGVPQAGSIQLPPYEDSVCIEVLNAEEGNKVISSLSAPMLNQ